MKYPLPGETGAPIAFRKHYDNWIGGKFVAPVEGTYFDVITPITGKVFTKAARSGAADIEHALDAAHAAADAWGKTSVTARSNILLKIAAIIEANSEKLAYAEAVDNGKPIRESLAADVPLAADHFKYFAAALRTQEGSLAQLDEDTVAYHYAEPLGVVGQIIPWNFSLLMFAWKIAPALAGGNCIVIKPAESTPISSLLLCEMVGDLLPPGVLNVVNGYGKEAGGPLIHSKRIAKLAFTGSTATGKIVAAAAAVSMIPVTLELGGKSPNVFFSDIMAADDAFFDKAIEGLVLFAFNQGEVCTCPSRALIQEDIYDAFMARVLPRVRAIKQGSPLDTDTMLGAQASQMQMDKIESYLKLGVEEGAQCLVGGTRASLPGELAEGLYINPTIFKGNNKMRIFREEVFGPFLSVCTFRDEAEALAIANDTPYGLGAGVWTRDVNRAQRMARGIKAGRVWVNCYHLYPAHAAFGGYKESGHGRETHLMALSAYQQTKNVLQSYSDKALGFF